MSEVLADALYHGMRGTRAEELAGELAQLTPAACRRVIEQHIAGAPKVLVVLGQASKLAAALNEIGPTEMVSIDRVLH
ncbi:MAG: hypothetical protein U1E76_22655 [Planctomycetota bacterium]